VRVMSNDFTGARWTVTGSCYTARARPKCPTEEKCFRLCLNRARELQHKISVFIMMNPYEKKSEI